MFWRMRREVFSNLIKQRLILLYENPFVLNFDCQAVEREREREREREYIQTTNSEIGIASKQLHIFFGEREYIQTTNSEIDVFERSVLLMDAVVLLALHRFVPIT